MLGNLPSLRPFCGLLFGWYSEKKDPCVVRCPFYENLSDKNGSYITSSLDFYSTHLVTDR